MDKIGTRLRAVREARGIGLREAARQLDVSASFLSQLETGKSQPSVSTLYSLTRLLDVSIDQLLADDAAAATVEAIRSGTVQADADAGAPASASTPAPRRTTKAAAAGSPVSRSAVGGPVEAWAPSGAPSRFEIARPQRRRQIAMDSGVVWEQLATNSGHDMQIMQVEYPPHSSSTSDGRMLRHEGYEFGFVLEGTLEITYGFDSYEVSAGDSFGFDSGVPHLFRNPTDEPVRFLSCNRHYTSTPATD